MSMIELEQEASWDGQILSVWINAGKHRILCNIPRETIHVIPLFSDAISREIRRDRHEILTRLRPAIEKKIAAVTDNCFRLHPADLTGVKF